MDDTGENIFDDTDMNNNIENEDRPYDEAAERADAGLPPLDDEE